MNQAIQILDGFDYDSQHQALKVVAIYSGALINCWIIDVLQDEAAEFYQLHQFEIEEQLASLISQEKWNTKGEIVLTKVDLTF